MDLHVVEMPIAYRYGRKGMARVQIAPEWELFREAEVYAAVDGEVSFAQARIDLEETNEDDPVADVAPLGGRIAQAVAEGAVAGKKVMMVGGNCTCVPGMIGGLQQGLGGPNVEQTLAALDRIFATGRVAAFALVSLYAFLPQGDKSVDVSIAILKPALERWVQNSADPMVARA